MAGSANIFFGSSIITSLTRNPAHLQALRPVFVSLTS
jgi:hypothetical protein